MSKERYAIRSSFADTIDNTVLIVLELSTSIGKAFVQSLVTQGCHYIGTWDTDEYSVSDVESCCESIVRERLRQHATFVKALYKNQSLVKSPVSTSDIETETVESSSDSAGMHENSPISATIGDITTPSGKMKNESSGSINRTVTRDNAHESLERIRAFNEIENTLEDIIHSAICAVVDEYQSMY